MRGKHRRPLLKEEKSDTRGQRRMGIYPERRAISRPSARSRGGRRSGYAPGVGPLRARPVTRKSSRNSRRPPGNGSAVRGAAPEFETVYFDLVDRDCR